MWCMLNVQDMPDCDANAKVALHTAKVCANQQSLSPCPLQLSIREPGRIDNGTIHC